MLRPVLAVFLFLALDEDASAQNAAGCHSSADECLVAGFEWQDDALVASYTNRCEARIFMRYCHAREDMDADCGQSGIEGLQTLVVNTATNATGAVRFQWVGSTNAENDLVCAEQAGDWDEELFD